MRANIKRLSISNLEKSNLLQFLLLLTINILSYENQAGAIDPKNSKNFSILLEWMRENRSTENVWPNSKSSDKFEANLGKFIGNNGGRDAIYSYLPTDIQNDSYVLKAINKTPKMDQLIEWMRTHKGTDNVWPKQSRTNKHRDLLAQFINNKGGREVILSLLPEDIQNDPSVTRKYIKISKMEELILWMRTHKGTDNVWPKSTSKNREEHLLSKSIATWGGMKKVFYRLPKDIQDDPSVQVKLHKVSKFDQLVNWMREEKNKIKPWPSHASKDPLEANLGKYISSMGGQIQIYDILPADIKSNLALLTPQNRTTLVHKVFPNLTIEDKHKVAKKFFGSIEAMVDHYISEENITFALEEFLNLKKTPSDSGNSDTLSKRIYRNIEPEKFALIFAGLSEKGQNAILNSHWADSYEDIIVDDLTAYLDKKNKIPVVNKLELDAIKMNLSASKNLSPEAIAAIQLQYLSKKYNFSVKTLDGVRGELIKILDRKSNGNRKKISAVVLSQSEAHELKSKLLKKLPPNFEKYLNHFVRDNKRIPSPFSYNDTEQSLAQKIQLLANEFSSHEPNILQALLNPENQRYLVQSSTIPCTKYNKLK